jgi:two-component system sensor histidine kinase FlrB
MSVTCASPAPDRAASLTQAFADFNALSEQLTQAYARLEAQVAELAAELARSRAAREAEQQQRRQADDRLSVLLEVLPAAVILVDGRGRIDRFNPAAEALFEGLRWGRRWQEVRDDNLLSQWDEGDWLLRNRRRLSVSSRALNDGGEILLLVDVTAQRELEERAARQDRLADMGEMAAQLAHQIRTPLATALLYGGQLGRDDLDPAQRRQFAATLVEGLKHTERLVSDMLAFSRGGHFQPNSVSLREVVVEAVDSLGPRLSDEAITLKLHLDEAGECQVLGNRDALRGVLGNLIDNALYHAGEGGHLQVSLEAPEDGRVRLRVEDDGPGIPPDIRERIFDPFFTTRERGTGLGLAVAQAVVLAHGGDIRLCDSALGGACFQIELPRLDAAETGETA